MVNSEWVVLELTSQGEDEDPDVLRSSLSRTYKGATIFIPASVSKVGGSRVVHKLIDNYVFLKKEQPDHYYFKAEGTKYVNLVLTSPQGRSRKLSLVKDSDIAKMKRQIQVETEQGIEVDDEVEIMSGPYRGIKGRVIEEIKENDTVQVYINLRSKQTIVTLPRSFLKFASSEVHAEVSAFAPFLTKVARTHEIIRRARDVIEEPYVNIVEALKRKKSIEVVTGWATKMTQLVQEVTDLRRADEWVTLPNLEPLRRIGLKTDLLHRFLHSSPNTPPSIEVQPLNPLLKVYKRVSALADTALPFGAVQAQVAAASDLATPTVSKLVAQLKKVELLHRVEIQGRAIKAQLSKIETSIRKAEENARSKRSH